MYTGHYKVAIREGEATVYWDLELFIEEKLRGEATNGFKPYVKLLAILVERGCISDWDLRDVLDCYTFDLVPADEIDQ